MPQLRIMKSEIRLTLHATRQLLVYAGDVHIPAGNIVITNKNTEVLVVASREIGLDVYKEKTECCVHVSGPTGRKKQNKETK